MTLLNFDVFEFEATLFGNRVQRLVNQIYLDAHKSIDLFYSEEFDRAAKQMAAAKDGDERLEASNYQDAVASEKSDRLQALATMALAMLGALIESLLRDNCNRMNRICPAPAVKKYQGSTLERRSDEYKYRFGIDLIAIPGFDGVREVTLARNSCLHDAGTPSDHYRRQTKCRLIGSDDRINLTEQQLDEISAEVREFVDVLHQHLSDICKGKKKE